MKLLSLARDSFQGVAMGMMDGVITLLGIVMGVGVATGDSRLIIISGFVGGISNSLGTSVGFYTSEHAERGQQIQFYKKKGRKKMRDADKYIHTKSEIYFETAFSFLASVVALVVPITPFFFSIPLIHAMGACFVISSGMLYLLGYNIGKLNREKPHFNGFKYLLIGIFAALVALAVGELLRQALGAGPVQ